MSAAIEAVRLSAGYGQVAVVRELDLAVAPGEIVALLGRNGAGKTTTLLTLAGRLRATSGEVQFAGRPERSRLDSRARRGIGLMTDDRAVFFGLSVRENLILWRWPEKLALAAFPELEPLLDQPAGLLSGGQQQILALARLIAARPQVLLIDEMSLGLAPVVVTRLMRALRSVADDGAAVLLVEQHAHVVLDVADRACVLVNGRAELTATVAELRANPSWLARAYLGDPTGKSASSAGSS